jgi:DedD protein
MGFLSRFKRKAAEATSPAGTAAAKRGSGGSNSGNNTTTSSDAPADEVMRARVRARQRLIGAAVLVVIGIVGFPLVFETQPRPIPVDIPIEIPKKDGAPALVMPPARGAATPSREASAPAASTTSSTATTNAAAAPPVDEVITEAPADAGRPVVSTASAAGSAKPPATKPAEAAKPAEPKPADAKPHEPKVAAATPAADSARAKALLDGKDTGSAKAEASGRFVVQVGAFADAAAARETRQKVEKLGLKTYTQVAATASGSRIRVRVGPFASRDEADKALAKAKGAGLNAVVLTL